MARKAMGGKASKNLSAIERVRAYAEAKAADLVKVADFRAPMRLDLFEVAAGFIDVSPEGMFLLVPAARFRSEFRQSEAMMREL